MMSEYAEMVQSLSGPQILEKWPEITPLKSISGVPKSAGNSESDEDGGGREEENIFDGHDEEQIKLMEELCIVLDYKDKPIGAGTKKVCHMMKNIDQGLLHRAFSVFLFNGKGEVLLQQRADEKITFPGMWTNTCCSHPLCFSDELGISPSEGRFSHNDLSTAIAGAKKAAQRKLEHELGIPFEDSPIKDFQFLTRIHYKSASGTEDTSKWGEHEIDYILILNAKKDVRISANYNEVKDYKYVGIDELKLMLEDKNLVFTPWFRLICQSFLFKWWDNLDNLESFKDDTIHRLL